MNGGIGKSIAAAAARDEIVEEVVKGIEEIADELERIGRLFEESTLTREKGKLVIENDSERILDELYGFITVSLK